MLLSYTHLLLISCIAITYSEVRFTNVKCVTLDPTFSHYEQCDLKVMRRGVVGMNIVSRLHQVPIANISVNFLILKKANGYRPFLYNVTLDFCDFLKHRAKYPLINIAFNAISKKSNINHSCPYDHDLIVRNWVLLAEAFRLLPVPSGDYAFVVKMAAYNDWKAEVKAYFSMKE